VLPHHIDWVIVGGESGAGARPCALEWIEDVVRDCRAAKVPVFVKQLGACVVSEARTAPVELMPGKPEEYAEAPRAQRRGLGLARRAGGREGRRHRRVPRRAEGAAIPRGRAVSLSMLDLFSATGGASRAMRRDRGWSVAKVRARLDSSVRSGRIRAAHALGRLQGGLTNAWIETLMREGEQGAKKKNATIVDPEGEVGPEILAKAIVEVSEAAKKLLASRLTRRALLILLKDASGESMDVCGRVLDAAADLRRTYVK
jgi:hypothetical protein